MSMHNMQYFQSKLSPEARQAMMQSKSIPRSYKITPEHVRAVCCEAYYPFKECAMGTNCVTATTPEFNFVMMSYLSPQQLRDVHERGVLPSARNLCYACLLFTYNYNLCVQRERKSSCSYVNTEFYHEVDCPGGYKKCYMAASVTGVTDQEAATPVHLQFTCGNESSGGLTHPLRRWAPTDYVSALVDVVTPERFAQTDSQREHRVKALIERDEVFFIQPASTKKEPPKVRPFLYMRHAVSHEPTTVEMLCTFFASTGKSSAAVGRSRMRTLCHQKNSTVTLPVYWAWQNQTHIRGVAQLSGFVAFPFEYIFCKDVRHTAAHLDELLVGGRIRIDLHLESEHDRREVINYVVDPAPPLAYYDGQLAGASEARRLRVAHTLRLRVLDTVHTMYPNSKSNVRDAVVRKLLCIFEEWNRTHYEALFAAGEGVPAADAIDRVVRTEVPLHYYASTFDFLEVNSNLAVAELPATYAAARSAPEERWLFAEFREARALLRAPTAAEHHIDDADVRRLWCDRRHFDVPERFAKLDTLPASRFRKHYSIVWCAVVRVNQALEMERSAMQHYELLENEQRRLETEVLAQRNATTAAAAAATGSSADSEGRRRRSSAGTVTMKEVYDGRRHLHSEQRYAYMLRLFAYTHMALVQRILDLALVRDEALCAAVPRPGHNNFLTHYEECYPYATRTPHEGMLPDLSNVVTCVSFVGNNSAEPRGGNESRVPALLYMWRKFLPRCCQGRNKDQKHVRCCELNEAYLQLTLNCLELSLLGAYQHCTRRPTYLRALQAHKTLGTDYDRRRFLQLQHRCPMMNVLAMIEALVFFTRMSSAYRAYVIAKYPAYVNFERRILARADAMRTRWGQQSWSAERTEAMVRELFANSADTDGLRGNLLSDLTDRDINNSHVYRTIVVDPISMLCGHIAVVNRKRYQSNKQYVRPDMPVALRNAIIARVQSMEPNAPINLASVLTEFNFGLRASDPNQLNVQPYTLTRLSAALDFIAGGEKAAFMEKVLREIPPKDWEVVDLFMNTLATHNCFNLLPLTDDIYEQQKRALERRFGVPYDTIEYCSRALLVTQCCNQVCTYDSHATNHTSYGHDKVCMDLDNGRIVCRRNREANNARKRKRSERSTYKAISDSLPAENNARLMRAYNHLRKRPPAWAADRAYRYQPLCGKAPVLMLPLCGFVVQRTERRPSANIKTPRITNAFTICCNCGAVCGFSRGLYGINGFSCTECEKQHIFRMMTPRCVACEVYLKLEECDLWQRFMVFDDRWNGGDMLLSAAYVCSRCIATKNSMFHGQHIVMRSELEAAKRSTSFKKLLQLRDGSVDLRKPEPVQPRSRRRGAAHALCMEPPSDCE